MLAMARRPLRVIGMRMLVLTLALALPPACSGSSPADAPATRNGAEQSRDSGKVDDVGRSFRPRAE